MKQIRIAALLLALALIFTACTSRGGKPTEAPAPETQTKTEPAKTEAPKTEAPETEVPKTEAPETEAPKTEAPETEAPETEPSATEPGAEVSLHGEITGDAYVNESLKLKITKPAGWVFYTEDQLAQANNMTVDLFKDTDYAELIQKNGQFMDMMMSDGAGSSVNLIIQPKQAALDFYTDEQIFTLAEESMRAQFAAVGVKVKTMEPLTAQVGGQERTVLHIVLDSAVAVEEYQVWHRIDSDYMGIVTVAVMGDTDPQPILDGITTVE